MSLRDFINEAGKKQKSEIKVDLNTILSDIDGIYDNNNNMIKFLKRITPPSSEKHLKFFYVVDNENEHGETSINYNEDNSKQPTSEFKQILDKIKKKKPTEWEELFDKGLDSINDANRKSYIERYFIPKVRNPSRSTKDVRYADRGIVASASQYRTLGKAMVFYAGKCVSKLTDTDTKIDPVKFQEILQGVFGAAPEMGKENDSFLMQFITIEPKLKIDAAKNVINSIKQAGTSDNGEIEEESYAIDLKDVLNFLFEDDETSNETDGKPERYGNYLALPKRVEDFAGDVKIALKQAKNVAEKFPKQYKLWHEKLTAEFNKGVEEYQKLEREPNTKEIENPITGKIEKRHGKAWGLGGPNAFIRNSETLNKIVQDIKGQKWTIFNCGAKIVLGLFDAMEKGGKFYQDICDRMGGGFNQLKHAFKNTRPEDFDKLIKQYSGKDEKEAMNAAYAGVVCSLSQLYKILAYGKIGTINADTCTFNTENAENNVPLIQVRINNLLSSIKSYTEEEKVYNKWLEETKKKQEEHINALEKQVNSQEGQQNNNQNNDQNNDQNNPQQNNSYKPVSLKNFINEADVEGEEKNIENVKKELENLKNKKAKAGEIAINNYIAILDDYKDSIKMIPEIQETFAYLRDKLFDEGRAKDTAMRLSNKGSNEDNSQENNNANKTESFKLKLIGDKLSFDTDIKINLNEAENQITIADDEASPGESNDNDSNNNSNGGNGGNTSTNNTGNNNNSSDNNEPNVSKNQGNLDWIENGTGKALCKIYEVMSENGDSLNINKFKDLANAKKEQEAKQGIKRVFNNLVSILENIEVLPIKDGIIGMYSNSGELDVTPQNVPGAIEIYGEKKEQNQENNNEQKPEEQKPGTNHEENLKKLQGITGNDGTIFKDVVSKLNELANSGSDDSWFNQYQQLQETAHKYEAEIIEILKAAYGNSDRIQNVENNIKNSVFLTGLWTAISAAKLAMTDLNNQIESDKKNQKQNQEGNNESK